MKKRRGLALLLFISDLIVLYLLHRYTGMARVIHFARYAFMYFMLGCIFGTFTIHTNLIWDEFQKYILWHSSFFLAVMAMNPLRRFTPEYFFVNLFIALIMLVFSIWINRTFRVVFRDCFSQNLIILGTGDNASRIAYICNHSRFPLSKLVAVIDCSHSKQFPDFEQEKKWFEKEPVSYDELDKVLSENHIDEAIIAMPDSDKELVNQIYQAIRDRVEVIKTVPKVDGTVSYGAKVEDFDGTVLISSSIGLIQNDIFGLLIKRVIDILGGLAGLLLLIPLSIYVKIGNLKCGDHGPLFYTQDRIGKNGKTFKLIKYRSMVVGAEEKLEKLMNENPAIREEYLTNKKLVNDPRITDFGKKIRSKSIDEMPQLLNVLMGSMSLVGPRPYLIREIEDMGDTYSSVIGCKPGLTGMWQTHGRSEASWNDRLWFDEYYYRNWSIWLDLTILFKTAGVVFKHDGAY